jgi:phosphotriesterase-related protein
MAVPELTTPSQVETVRGAIPTTDLGVVFMHEHVFILSHEIIDWLPEALVPVAMPNWHYRHIHNDVLPALRQRGVTDEQITTMLVDNPRNIFSKQGAYE